MKRSSTTLFEGGDEGAEGDDRRHPEGHREADVRVVPAGEAPRERRPPLQGRLGQTQEVSPVSSFLYLAHLVVEQENSLISLEIAEHIFVPQNAFVVEPKLISLPYRSGLSDFLL